MVKQQKGSAQKLKSLMYSDDRAGELFGILRRLY